MNEQRAIKVTWKLRTGKTEQAILGFNEYIQLSQALINDPNVESWRSVVTIVTTVDHEPA